MDSNADKSLTQKLTLAYHRGRSIATKLWNDFWSWVELYIILRWH